MPEHRYEAVLSPGTRRAPQRCGGEMDEPRSTGSRCLPEILDPFALAFEIVVQAVLHDVAAEVLGFQDSAGRYGGALQYRLEFR